MDVLRNRTHSLDGRRAVEASVHAGIDDIDEPPTIIQMGTQASQTQGLGKHSFGKELVAHEAKPRILFK